MSPDDRALQEGDRVISSVPHSLKGLISSIQSDRAYVHYKDEKGRDLSAWLPLKYLKRDEDDE